MNNKEKNFISAVVYVHNDAAVITPFLEQIIEILDANFENSEVICVNDASEDDSVEKIRKIADNTLNTTITVLNMSHFHGLELAMNAGVDLSIGDFVYEFDIVKMDFEKDVIMQIYHKVLEGFDIVSASSDENQKASSKIFYKVFNRFTELSVKMYTESFRLLSRRVINRVNSMNKTVPYRKVIYANCGLKTTNLRYSVVKSNWANKLDKQERRYRKSLAADSLILFTELGYRFSMWMTFAMMSLTVAVAIYAVAVYLLKTPIAGWTTTILFLAFAFFGLFGILTIIIKYLAIIVNLVFKRQRYSFESIEKLTK